MTEPTLEFVGVQRWELNVRAPLVRRVEPVGGFCAACRLAVAVALLFDARAIMRVISAN